MVAQENIPLNRHQILGCLTIYTNEETSAPLGTHFMSMVLIGGKLKVDLLRKSSHWLIASMACDPLVASSPG